MFILALVLNPFEGISRFGDKAAVSPFTLNMILLQVALNLFIFHLRRTIDNLMSRHIARFVLALQRFLIPMRKRKSTRR
jgi:hypothetical protein